MPNCGTDPPMPPGYSSAQGHVTPQIQQWAHELAFDSRTQYGDIYVRDFKMADGSQVHIAIRIEHHTFTVNPDGTQTPGCYKGATAYFAPLSTPDTESPVPVPQGAPSSGTILGYVSLGLVLFSTAFGVAHAVLSARARHAGNLGHRRVA